MYRAVSLGTPAATTAVHSIIIAVVDTAVCCLLFLLKHKRVAPVLVGNAVTWPIYLRMKRTNPGLNRRKTIAEELKDAVAKEAAKRPAPPEQPSKPVASERPEPSGDALFGPQADRSPMVSRSVQEEAMLFYEDDDDEEAGND